MHAVVLESLIRMLREARFPVGVDHYLRVRALVQRVGDKVPPPELKYLLAPLFATKKEEQNRFYAVFDAWLASFPDEPLRLEPETPPVDDTRLRRPRMLAAAFVTVVLLVLAAVALAPWFLGRSEKTVDTTTEASTTSAVVQTVTTTTRLVLDTREEATKRNDYLMFLAALLLGVLAWDLGRAAMRWATHQDQGPHGKPFALLLREDSAKQIVDTERLNAAVVLLRARQEGVRRELDVGGTVAATVRNAGLPRIVERTATELPEYVLLIDRRSVHDHQAEYFERLAAILGRSVVAQTWFFDRDPRVVTNDEATMAAAELFERTPDATLLLCGDGAGLLDPLTGDLAPWVEDVLRWDMRVVLTPSAPTTVLRRSLLVFPGSTAGVAEMAEALRGAPLMPPRFEPRLPDRPGVEEMRAALPEPLFRWLCGCAVQETLQWDATLAIGRALGEITDASLLRLASIEWFRMGAIPERQRFQLLDHLRCWPDAQRVARAADLETLRRATATPRSFAAAALTVRMATHQMFLAPEARDAREAAASLRALPTRVVLRGAELRRALLSRDALGWWRGVPPLLRRALLRGGAPLLGRRNFTATMLALAPLAIAGGMVVATVPATRQVPFERKVTETVRLETATPTQTQTETQIDTQTDTTTSTQPQIATTTTTAPDVQTLPAIAAKLPVGTPVGDEAVRSRAEAALRQEMELLNRQVADAKQQAKPCSGSAMGDFAIITFRTPCAFTTGPAVLYIGDGAVDVTIASAGTVVIPGALDLESIPLRSEPATTGTRLVLAVAPEWLSRLLELMTTGNPAYLEAGGVRHPIEYDSIQLPRPISPPRDFALGVGDRQALMLRWDGAPPVTLFIDCNHADEKRINVNGNEYVFFPNSGATRCEWNVTGRGPDGKMRKSETWPFTVGPRTVQVTQRKARNFEYGGVLYADALVVEIAVKDGFGASATVNGQPVSLAASGSRFMHVMERAKAGRSITTRVTLINGVVIQDVQPVP